jgi:predicted transcriptional regulator of viral defense system
MEFRELYMTLEKNKFYIFSYNDILSFYPREKIDTLKKMFRRWRENGWLYLLKRGLYELTYPKDYNLPDIYIANRLYSPSYVSLETALSNFSIIPEVSMAVTSVSTKPTRQFKNKHGLFIYHTLKPEFFNGYYVEKHGVFDILIAEPEKALIDFLYFKSFRDKNFNLKNERLDKDVISRLNKKKLNKYAKLFNISLRKYYAYL